MTRKDLLFYAFILILTTLFLWQWLSKGALVSQLNKVQHHNNQLQLLAGIGQLGSTHLHADVKVYINGQSIDFSQKRYQLTTSFIHFEEGVGYVVHTHATGLTLWHLFKSVGMDFNNNCIVADKKSYCNDGNKTRENQRFSGPRNSERISRELKFYVNGQSSNEFDNHIIKDLDKYLVSYGSENEADIQKQLNSVTNLAPRYSLQK